jgi:hypothetical protein
MNYNLGRYFYNLSLVARNESLNAFFTNNTALAIRAGKRAKSMRDAAKFCGYLTEDYEKETGENYEF